MPKVPYTFLDVSKKRHLKLKPLNKNNADIMGILLPCEQRLHFRGYELACEK